MVFFGQNISDALDRRFISKTMKAPLLEREEEVELVKSFEIRAMKKPSINLYPAI